MLIDKNNISNEEFVNNIKDTNFIKNKIQMDNMKLDQKYSSNTNMKMAIIGIACKFKKASNKDQF